MVKVCGPLETVPWDYGVWPLFAVSGSLIYIYRVYFNTTLYYTPRTVDSVVQYKQQPEQGWSLETVYVFSLTHELLNFLAKLSHMQKIHSSTNAQCT